MRKWIMIGVGTMILAWIPYLTKPTSSNVERTPPDAPPIEAKAAQPAPPAEAEESSTRTRTNTSTTPEPPIQAPPLPLAQRIASFRQAFDSEPRDAFWANDQEPALSSLMEAEEFTTDDISEIACRRTVCRIVFKDPQPTANRTFTALARLRGHFADVHFVAQEQASDPPAQLYLLRQGYALDATTPK